MKSNYRHETLSALFWLRWVAMGGQFIALAVAEKTLQFPVSWSWLGTIFLCTIVWNIGTGWQLRNTNQIADRHISLQLLFDVAQLSVVLYLSGGAQNPFVSLLLLPIIIGVLGNNVIAAFSSALAAIVAYLILMRFSPELHWHIDHRAQMNAHVFGMWINFVITALLLTGFGLKLLHKMRRRDEAIRTLREKNLQNESLVSLGTQAAHVAHQFGTPLNTMMLLCEELKHHTADSETRAILDDLDTQIIQCRKWLDTLRNQHTPLQQMLGDSLQKALEEWRWYQPQAELAVAVDFTPLRNVEINASFEAAFLNLLNNAFQASRRNRSNRVAVHTKKHHDSIKLHIDDWGTGFNQAARASQEGLGIGITLANASIESLGGSVTWQLRDEQGTRTTITLPKQGAKK